MRASALHPGQYLKAADLQGMQITVSIDKVAVEDIGGDSKPVLYFIGKEKGMVLNKTNTNNIAFLYGDETDDWHGKQVVLFEAIVDFQGKSTPAIRVKGPARPRQAEAITTAPQRMTGGISDNAPAGHPINDDIPF